MDVLYWSICGLISAIVWLILFPALIYYAYKFWSHREVDIIQKRNPVVVISFAIFGTAIHLSYSLFCVYIQSDIIFVTTLFLCYVQSPEQLIFLLITWNLKEGMLVHLEMIQS